MSKKRIHKISFRKENENPNGLQNKVFVTAAWFKSDNFRNYEDKRKKAYVKKVLEKVDRKDISDKFDLEETEKVVVNKKPNYSLDQAVFNEEVELPNHLIDDYKNNSGSTW